MKRSVSVSPSARTLVATIIAVGMVTSVVMQPDPSAQAVPRSEPVIAVRNERPRAGQEVLVLRHQELKKGAHDEYYRASLAGVWPWYEQIGTRIVDSGS